MADIVACRARAGAAPFPAIPDSHSLLADRVQAHVADPLHHDRITLLLWAGADRCAAPAGSAVFAAAAPRAVLTAQAFPGLCHETCNEPERGEVVSHLLHRLARF